MTDMKDGGWTSHLKTIHIAKEPEYKERKKIKTNEGEKNNAEGTEIKLRYYDLL